MTCSDSLVVQNPFCVSFVCSDNSCIVTCRKGVEGNREIEERGRIEKRGKEKKWKWEIGVGVVRKGREEMKKISKEEKKRRLEAQ